MISDFLSGYELGDIFPGFFAAVSLLGLIGVWRDHRKSNRLKYEREALSAIQDVKMAIRYSKIGGRIPYDPRYVKAIVAEGMPGQFTIHARKPGGLVGEIHFASREELEGRVTEEGIADFKRMRNVECCLREMVAKRLGIDAATIEAFIASGKTEELARTYRHQEKELAEAILVAMKDFARDRDKHEYAQWIDDCWNMDLDAFADKYRETNPRTERKKLVALMERQQADRKAYHVHGQPSGNWTALEYRTLTPLERKIFGPFYPFSRKA